MLQAYDGQSAACGFHPVSHAADTVAGGRYALRVKPCAVVFDFNHSIAFTVVQADDDFCGLRIFANVGERFLHQAVSRQLRRATELDVLQVCDEWHA